MLGLEASFIQKVVSPTPQVITNLRLEAGGIKDFSGV